MSSACPDCTSRTRCVNHAGDVARRSVDSYVPKALRPEDWEPIAGFTRALAHDLHPKDDRRAVEVMRTLSQVVSWAHRDGLPLDRERIFTPDVIDRYIAVGAAHLSEPSRATRRADLRRFSRSLTRKGPWEPEPPRMRGGYSIVPYTDDEVARLLEVSRQQRTPVQARRLQALLALGLGVGVYPNEAWALTTHDVFDDQGYVCVRIPGEHARTVPVTARTTRSSPRSWTATQARRSSDSLPRSGIAPGCRICCNARNFPPTVHHCAPTGCAPRGLWLTYAPVCR